MKAAIKIILVVVIFVVGFMVVVVEPISVAPIAIYQEPTPRDLFVVKSIDTMKYSRDMAREMQGKESFDSEIDQQMTLIKDAGATHVAISTPYDEEFAPVLARWVSSARAHGLSVWYRGNFSGWEGWFGYKRIGENEHKRLLAQFLEKHPELFVDGDIFTPCPECENGGPGDPRRTGKKSAYNALLVEEYKLSMAAFEKNGVDVSVLTSMNKDIATDVLNKSTAQALGKTILIDHYAKSIPGYIKDVQSLGERLGATIGLGETGAPIPDIHGAMDPETQATYLNTFLHDLYESGTSIPIINYWTLKGGSTALVENDGSVKPAYDVLKTYYSLQPRGAVVVDTLGQPVVGASVSVVGGTKGEQTNAFGMFTITLLPGEDQVLVTAPHYEDKVVAVSTLDQPSPTITLIPQKMTLIYRFRLLVSKIYQRYIPVIKS